MSLKFYEVDKNYIIFLKKYDGQVPDFIYSRHNKFVCGVVFKIGDIDYFAPISSFKQQQRTNIVILDKGIPISSIRFCFMIPAPPQVVKLKDFSVEPQSYQDLLNAEIKFCNSNVNRIFKKAEEVYKIGSNRSHPLAYSCCGFKLLEAKCVEYISLIIELGQTAATCDEKDRYQKL